MEWPEYAVCRDLNEPLTIMFPLNEDADTPLAAHEVEVAKSVCRGCPVIHECGRWAMDTGQAFGIWGGLSSPERRVLAAQRVS